MNTIITNTHIETIDSEINWIESLNVIKWVEWIKNYHSAMLRLSNWFKIEVYFNDFSLFELLEEKFEIINKKEYNDSLWKLYFNSTYNTKALWFINNNSNTAYVEWDWFWIFKSAISWLATLWCNWNESILPVHWSAIKSEQTWWIMMVWWHRVGKTTWLLNMSQLLWEGEVVSDDWLLADIQNKDLYVSSTDNSISISQKTIKENPHITQINTPQVKNDVLKRKTSYKPELLLWEWFKKNINQVKVDKIILLVTWVKKAITILSDLNNVPDFIVWATYHFPYFNQEIKNNHIEKWNNTLKESWTDILVFDHTHFDNMVKWYSTLINTIIKWTK